MMVDRVSNSSLPELVHPVYLDVPMTINFIAALEGGVSYEDQSTTKTGVTSSREREGRGGARLPGIASLFGVGFDMSGRLESKSGQQTSQEVVAVRRHTEASLFNLLRQRLIDAGELRRVVQPSDLDQLEPGALIEVTGEALGNPLRQVLELLAQFLPYMGITEEGLTETLSGTGKSRRRNPRKSGNPAVAAAADENAAARAVAQEEAREQAQGILLALKMHEDLKHAHVQDYLLAAQDDLSVVLTLSTEFFTPQTSEYLLAGEFRAIGKVTRILRSGATIDLTRRTVLGAVGGDARDSVMDAAAEMQGVNLADPVVAAPAVQMLPLAVFV